MKQNVIGLFAVVFLLSSCGKKEEEEKKQPIKVRTETLQETNFEKKITLTGDIEAIESVEVFPKIAGKVLSFALESGKSVSENTLLKKDEVFAILDHEEMDIGMKQAKANKERADAALKIAKVNVDQVRKDKERMENLYAEGAITAQQRDMAAADLEKVEGGYLQAKAHVIEAESFLEKAQMFLDAAFIKSPIDGVLSKKYVSKNNMAIPSQPLARIINFSELVILVGIPEKVITQIENSITKVEVGVDAYPGVHFQAEIEKVYPTIDLATRMGTLELRIKNNTLLKPGMFATVNLSFIKEKKAITVPFSSLIYHEGNYQAYVYKDGKAHLTKLTIGDRDDKSVEILQGLEKGEALIVLGQNKLTDQIDVSPIEIEQIHENN